MGNFPNPKIFAFFLVSSIAISSAKNLTQRFTLHADEGCQDEGETYTENVRDLGRVSAIVRTKSLRCACADFGVWSYSPKKNYYGGTFGGSSLAVTKLESNPVCLFPQGTQIRSIRKVGSSAVQLPAMSLYVDFSLRGRELYFDGTQLRLPWPILFRSLGFTGLNASWSLYAEPEMTGRPAVIGQANGTLITYSSGTRLSLIGAIQRSGDASSSLSPSLTLGLRDRSREISTDAAELRLPYPITVYTFTLVGPANWTLYRGVLLNGRSKCLVYTEGDSGPATFRDDQGGFPIAFTIVGSVRRGCRGSGGGQGEEDYSFSEAEDDIYDYEDDMESGGVRSLTTSGSMPSLLIGLGAAIGRAL